MHSRLLRPVLWLLWLGIPQMAGCGSSSSLPELESQVSGILGLETVSLQRNSDAVIEGRGVSHAGVTYRITVKGANDNTPLWFYADDSAGNRIMGPCDESLPRMALADVLAAADEALPHMGEDAADATRFNVIIRDGVWDVARDSPQNREGGTAVHIDDASGSAETYVRLAEVG